MHPSMLTILMIAYGRPHSTSIKNNRLASTEQLARETGLSETTIRYIGEPASRRNRASLVAIAVVGSMKEELSGLRELIECVNESIAALAETCRHRADKADRD
jgi:hypothetical protein